MSWEIFLIDNDKTILLNKAICVSLARIGVELCNLRALKGSQGESVLEMALPFLENLAEGKRQGKGNSARVIDSGANTIKDATANSLVVASGFFQDVKFNYLIKPYA